MQVIPGETPEQCDKRVKAGIAGRAPLPWEAKAEGSEEKLKKMRGLKRTVRYSHICKFCILLLQLL